LIMAWLTGQEQVGSQRQCESHGESHVAGNAETLCGGGAFILLCMGWNLLHRLRREEQELAAMRREILAEGLTQSSTSPATLVCRLRVAKTL
jgi:hypothetical protein